MALELFIYVSIIIFAASFVQGLTGFGFALVAIPLLSMIMDIKEAVPIGVLCGFTVNVYLILRLKQHVKFFDLKYLLIGAVAGIPVGSYILLNADTGFLKIVLGVIVILFVLLSLTKVIKQTGLPEKWGYLFGFFSGLFGGAFNTNGPPILIYFYLHGFDKFKQKASITGFFIVTSVTIIITHLVTGLSTLDTYIHYGYLLPVNLLGIVIGHSIFHKFSNDLYNKILLGALLIIGFVLLFN